MSPLTAGDQAVRHFIYRHFVEHARAPSKVETADHFGFEEKEAERVYLRLHGGHFIFLNPGTTEIRMAHPFSCIATAFRVRANGQAYFANCAWDMFGIPAALGMDAEIELHCADCAQPYRLEIRNGRPAPLSGLVHFLLPFSDWYEDLIFT